MLIVYSTCTCALIDACTCIESTNCVHVLDHLNAKGVYFYKQSGVKNNHSVNCTQCTRMLVMYLLYMYNIHVQC